MKQQNIYHFLEDVGLDLLEQPFSFNKWSNWKRFKNDARIPIEVDEAVISPRDLMEWIKQDVMTAFTTTVLRNGGLYSSFQCATIAEQANLLILSKGLTETGLGLATNLYLAYTFGTGRDFWVTTFLQNYQK